MNCFVCNEEWTRFPFAKLLFALFFIFIVSRLLIFPRLSGSRFRTVSGPCSWNLFKNMFRSEMFRQICVSVPFAENWEEYNQTGIRVLTRIANQVHTLYIGAPILQVHFLTSEMWRGERLGMQAHFTSLGVIYESISFLNCSDCSNCPSSLVKYVYCLCDTKNT